MGGRLMVTAVQVTIVLKGGYTETEAASFVDDLSKTDIHGWEIIDAYLDESHIKDVEV